MCSCGHRLSEHRLVTGAGREEINVAECRVDGCGCEKFKRE